MGVLKLEVFNKDSDSEFKKDYINHLNCIEAKRNIKFIDALNLIVDRKAKRKTESYASQYRTIVKHLTLFCELNNCDLYTNSITEDFLDDFILYLENINLRVNTIKGIIQKVKAMTRKLGTYGYIIDPTFDEVEVEEEITFSIYLSMNDITRIYYYKFEHQDKRKAKERIRDLFVIGCLTALRYSDYSTLEPENFQNGYIVKRTKKTNIVVRIPVHDYIKEIYDKYKGNIPTFNIQYFNRYIKLIMKEIGFDEKFTYSFTKGGKIQNVSKYKWELVSSHTARRSAATNMYLTGRMKTYEIMQLTGHTSEKNFFRYIKVTSEQSAKHIAGDSFFNK